jgi:hypothetical protein
MEDNAEFKKAREDYLNNSPGETVEDYNDAVRNSLTLENGNLGTIAGNLNMIPAGNYDAISINVDGVTYKNQQVYSPWWYYTEGENGTTTKSLSDEITAAVSPNEYPVWGTVALYKGIPYMMGSWGYWVEILGEGTDKASDSPNMELAAALRKSLNTYETGGLADFTGPAWLDGTKAHPELVLNARDTQNFIQLKDILADILDGNNFTSNNSQNKQNTVNTIDIDINVESIGDDYDVEQLADKIRSMLYDDATYRNVNAISLSH